MKQLTILVFHPRYCSRATKQIEALVNEGHKIILVAKKGWFPDYIKPKLEFHRKIRYSNNWIKRFNGRRILKKILVQYPIDLIHCHNEPNYHVLDAVRISAGRIPVVYDVHDLTSLRKGTADKYEEKCFRLADGVVHSSDLFRKSAEYKYGEVPSITINSIPLMNHFHSPTGKKDDGRLSIVYQGGIVDRNSTNHKLMGYRNYLKIFRSILKEDIDLHLYPASISSTSEYFKLADQFPNFYIHERVPFDKLIGELSKYDFGLVGFNHDLLYNNSTKTFLNAVVPNKPFDYLFAGIPSLIINADEVVRIAEKHGFGLRYDGKSWRSTAEKFKPRDFRYIAEKLSMDTQIKKLINFYKEVIANKK